MKKSPPKKIAPAPCLEKVPTGIKGLDQILDGGLPQGRPTLVSGGAGCGKTLLAMEFLVRGATEYGEPGVMMAFEERESELLQNTASLGFDLAGLIERKMLFFDSVYIAREEIEETGDYDLEGLFIRLGAAIDAVGAKRVVLDTLETLFSGFANLAILRSEFRRLFRWLKDKGVTAIITAERGENSLTRNGLEEYVSDCVILLDHRVVNQVSTRRLRVVKYRGSIHCTNEYPFLIHERGIAVMPITSLGLQHVVTQERVSSGVPALDEMLTGAGYFRGSTVLVSGTAGVGKSSLSAAYCQAAGRRAERVLYFSFEESPGQMIRNMASIGLDLQAMVENGLLQIHASRPTVQGLELLLAQVFRLVEEFQPSSVIFDPISSFVNNSEGDAANLMAIQLIDYLKMRGITLILTNLTRGNQALEKTDIKISSLVDTWILLRDIECGGERNRSMCVLKSRGMAHSNQLRELVLSGRGIELLPSYLGPGGVLTGSARLSQEAQEKAASLMRQQELESRRRDLERKREEVERQVESLRSDFREEEAELEQRIEQEQGREQQLGEDRVRLQSSRQVLPEQTVASV